VTVPPPGLLFGPDRAGAPAGGREPACARPGVDPGPTAGRPILLLSLPNTGTDWLVGLMLRRNPGLRYYREFFNPICNPKYEDVLGRAFGCEMVGSYERIVDPRCPCAEVYEQTWAREGYNFTKENYSAFKVGLFVGKFQCFVLYRRAEATLPGGRMQVKAWYDAMYWSLIRNQAALEPDVRSLVAFAAAEADAVNKRQVAAFVIYYYQLLKEAKRHGLVVIDYDNLMRYSPDELVPYVRGVPGVVDPEGLAQDISRTRRPAQKNFGELRADDFFARLRGLAERCGVPLAA
jgi:hypothetical protein